MILSDRHIRTLCVKLGSDDKGNPITKPCDDPMLFPFSEGVQGGGVISYGLSHAGYDLRLGDELLIFKNSWNATIDPKRFKDEDYCGRVFDKVTPSVHRQKTLGCVKDYCLGTDSRWPKCPNCGSVWSDEYEGRVILVPNCFTLPAHSYALGASLEYIRIPRYLKGRCVGKSTLARCGILINTTPLEPGWHGHLTIEISNITPCPALVYAREGIAQLEFEQLSCEPDGDYEQKGGKYQSQGSSPVPARVKE